MGAGVGVMTQDERRLLTSMKNVASEVWGMRAEAYRKLGRTELAEANDGYARAAQALVDKLLEAE